MTKTPPTPADRRWALILLVAISTVAFIDRSILAILTQSIKEDLGVSDTALGFLGGPTFAVFYTLLGIPIARLADRGVRRSILAVCLAIWSGMTALCGFAQTFFHLVIARIGVAVGEAGGSPPSHSMISDMFPQEQRGTALNIGSFVGGGTVREYAKGWEMGAANDAELEVMEQVVAEAMEDGAFGVAPALIYPPSTYSGTAELAAVAAVIARYGGVYISHVRNEAEQLLEGIGEAIEIGRRTGCAIEIYHLKASGEPAWPLMPRAIAMIAVVSGHAMASFMVTPIGWAIQDRSQFLGCDLAAWIIRAFSMPGFFWLAGYGGRALYDAKGAGAFARDRLVRIVLPLAILVVPNSLLLDVLWGWGREVGARGVVLQQGQQALVHRIQGGVCVISHH